MQQTGDGHLWFWVGGLKCVIPETLLGLQTLAAEPETREGVYPGGKEGAGVVEKDKPASLWKSDPVT